MFIDRLNQLLGERKLTRSKFLSDLSMGKNQFTYWKNGGTPNPATLKVIADYFDVPVDYLLGVEDQNAALMRVAIETLDEDTLAEQEKTLLAMFRTTSEEGRLRIIQAVMNIHDEEEKKSATTAEEVVG